MSPYILSLKMSISNFYFSQKMDFFLNGLFKKLNIFSQTSEHEGFVGRFPEKIRVGSGKGRTLVIKDLIVPSLR